MEFVRKIVDSSTLEQVLILPRSLLNREVGILVFPVQEKGKNKRAMEGSITQSLIGTIPRSDITPEEIRSMRLRKYDRSN